VAGAELGVGQLANVFFNFESLTINGIDGRALPRLAETWQWENNDLRLRINLRSGVVLHDDRPLTPEIAAGLVRLAVSHPPNVARYPSFSDIASVSAGEGLQLVIDLTRPSAMLPEDLTVPLDVGPESTGTGPFRIVSKEPEVVLERFDKYYMGRPSIARVVIRSFDTLRTSWASLLRGTVDMVYDVPADAVEFIRSDDIDVIPFPRWYQFVIAFNSQKGPLRSPIVRRALNLAVDRQNLIDKVLQGRGTPSTGPVWPKFWAYDSSITPYGFDPTEAQALLDRAGFPMPVTSDVAELPPARLRITCLVPENFSVWERVALEVQKDLFDIGVDMQFTALPVEGFVGRVQTGQFDAILNDIISGPTPGRASIFWRSARTFKGPYNIFGYENQEADRLIDVFRASTNDAAIRSATRRLQRVFLDDPPALFIAWNERARAINRRFQVPDDAGRDPILSVARWVAGAQSRQVAER
jgi:peptide/nickel transport system substrate-binding protein